MAVATVLRPSAAMMSALAMSSSGTFAELPLSLLSDCTFLLVVTLSCVAIVVLGCPNLAALAPAGCNFAGLSKPISPASLLFHFLLGTCSRFASFPLVAPTTAQGPSISCFVPPLFSLSKRALSPGRAAFFCFERFSRLFAFRIASKISTSLARQNRAPPRFLRKSYSGLCSSSSRAAFDPDANTLRPPTFQLWNMHFRRLPAATGHVRFRHLICSPLAAAKRHLVYWLSILHFSVPLASRFVGNFASKSPLGYFLDYASLAPFKQNDGRIRSPTFQSSELWIFGVGHRPNAWALSQQDYRGNLLLLCSTQLIHGTVTLLPCLAGHTAWCPSDTLNLSLTRIWCPFLPNAAGGNPLAEAARSHADGRPGALQALAARLAHATAKDEPPEYVHAAQTLAAGRLAGPGEGQVERLRGAATRGVPGRSRRPGVL